VEKSSKILTRETINPYVKSAEYAVLGTIPAHAEIINKVRTFINKHKSFYSSRLFFILFFLQHNNR
jgi:hypothetical protein